MADSTPSTFPDLVTIEALVTLAGHCFTAKDVSFESIRKLAGGVIALLGPPQNCGWEAPELVPASPAAGLPAGISVPASWVARVSSEDARDIGRMMFASADERDAADQAATAAAPAAPATAEAAAGK